MNNLNLQQGIALFEIALTCSIVIIYVCEYLFRQTWTLKQRCVWVMVPLIFLLLPLHWMVPLQLPLAAYPRAVVGDLSVVTSLLLWTHFFAPQPLSLPLYFKRGVVIIGAVFYPLALGVTILDPYAWGYGGLPLLWALVAVATFCWWKAWQRGAIIISLAILCWSIKLHESSNLWDYVLDPVLFVGCLVLLARHSQRIVEKSP